MKTKIQIIQQLLDDRKINAEEAMILMQTEKEYVYIPNYVPYAPFYVNPVPAYPLAPNWYTTSGDGLTISN